MTKQDRKNEIISRYLAKFNRNCYLDFFVINIIDRLDIK